MEKTESKISKNHKLLNVQMLSPSRDYKERVQENFSRRAGTYDSAAGLQYLAARLTAQLIKEKAHLIPEGPILEIGCGTGILSSFLPEIFPDRQIIFSDLSADMVTICRDKMSAARAEKNALSQASAKKKKTTESSGTFEWRVLDAEELKTHSDYAAIVSSFAIQWFFQPFKGISRLLSALRPEGALIFTVPGDDSCPQWKAAANKLEIPFTRNPLPAYDELMDFAGKMGLEFDIKQRIAEETYSDAAAMLHSLQVLGASTQKSDMRLSYLQLRKLMRELDSCHDEVNLTYQVISAFLRRV